MKVIEMESRPERLMFANFDRIDEEEIYRQVVQKLRSAPEITLGEPQMAPYADITNGEIHAVPFTLVFDLDYGAELICRDEAARQQLKALIESE